MPSSSWTPVKVRGKRKGLTEEKRPSTKRQRNAMPWRFTPLGQSSLIDVSGGGGISKAHPPARKSVLSRLEQLPTEMIQQIFLVSKNISLALASPRLTEQLSALSLYKTFADASLKPVTILGSDAIEQSIPPSGEDIARASRLVNSRFCTWDFFVRWLRKTCADNVSLCADGEPGNILSEECYNPTVMWQKLGGHAIRPLPSKLLVGPWTDEKISFLLFLLENSPSYFEQLEPQQHELTYQGYMEAIRSGCVNAVRVIGRLMVPDVELLRMAVIDCGCEKSIVAPMLIQCRLRDYDPNASQIFLDPAMWTWADQAKAKGDPKGDWLLDLIRLLRYATDEELLGSDIESVVDMHGMKAFLAHSEADLRANNHNASLVTSIQAV